MQARDSSLFRTSNVSGIWATLRTGFWSRLLPQERTISPAPSLRRQDAIIVTVLAVILIGAVAIDGVMTTRSMDWASGADTFRDIAVAEAIQQSFKDAVQHGRPIADP